MSTGSDTLLDQLNANRGSDAGGKHGVADGSSPQAQLERVRSAHQQLAYAVSHDLREPLRTVASYVQLISRRYRGQLDQDADDFIEFAVDGCHRMQQMIEGLLQLSRVEHRGQPLRPVDSSQALAKALADLAEPIASAQAEISFGELPEVFADHQQLATVFFHLIDNSIRFHGEKPPRVHIDSCRSGDCWKFTVVDNGRGIPQQHLSKVFTVFNRLQGREPGAGLGLGLALCQRIIERHHGQIYAESGPVGARFSFTLLAHGPEDSP